jgi:AsmA protein
MALQGPIVEATGSGSVDLVGRTLDFRIHPRLVAAGTSPVGAMVAGLSIPVVVEGPWDSPRAFPDFGGRSAPPGSAPAPDPLGALLGKGGLGALLDAIVPNTGPQRDCGRNCPKADEGPFGPRRPGTGPSGQP